MMLGAGLLCAWRSESGIRLRMDRGSMTALSRAVPVEQPISRAPAARPKPAPAPGPVDPRQLLPQMKQVFEHQGVPSSLVWIAEVESSWNPRAVSPSGAVGLFQFMPGTARRFGLVGERFDGRISPLRSARAAATYLRLLQDEFGSWRLSVAAYHAGEGRVGRLLKAHQVTAYEDVAPHLPAQTRRYVAKVQTAVFNHEGVAL